MVLVEVDVVAVDDEVALVEVELLPLREVVVNALFPVVVAVKLSVGANDVVFSTIDVEDWPETCIIVVVQERRFSSIIATTEINTKVVKGDNMLLK